MNFGDQLVRIRRQLRDPDGNVWSRSLLQTLYNNVQREINRRVRFLEDAQVLKYPPLYQETYIFDWEWPYLTGTRLYKALKDHQQGDYSYCFRWEPQSVWGSEDSTNDIAYNITQPWESFMGIVTDPIAIKFPENFHTAKFLSWDDFPIEYRPKKEISKLDMTFMTREGRPYYYYREDDQDNSFIPYPKPSTVSWEDEVFTANPIYVFSQSWEGDIVSGEQFSKDDDTNSRTYVYEWELTLGSLTETVEHGMWLFEIGIEPGTSVSYLTGDDTNQFGTFTRRDGSLLSQDLGLTVDILNADEDFFLIYNAEPTDLAEESDESDYPIFLRKYVEYGVLRDAYSSLTDGKIQSLRDYWSQRFELGIQAIKLYQAMRRQDRDYRLVTHDVPTRRSIRHPRLPSTYPPI